MSDPSLKSYSVFHRLWVDASSEETIQQDYLRIAEKINCDRENAVKSVILWLSEMSKQNIPWLLVFDDLHDQKCIERYLPFPSEGSGIVVVTSTKKFDEAGKALEIGPLEEEKALDLLLKVAKKRDADPIERHSAHILVKRLDQLPLAIKIAGSQIYKHKYRIQDFLEIWQKVFQETGHREQWQAGLVASLEMSYQRVAENGSQYAIELLHFFAFLHSENAFDSILLDAREAVYVREDWNGVPLGILREVESVKTPSSLQLFRYEVRDALRTLSDYHLLEFYDNGGVRIHSLIYNWIRHRLDDSGRQKWWKVTTTTVAISITNNCAAAEKTSIIPHLDSLLDLDRNSIFDLHLFQSTWDFEAAFQFADIYSIAGHFDKAYNLRKGIYAKLTENKHQPWPRMNNIHIKLMEKSLDLLAATCSDLGKHEEALRYRMQAIDLEQTRCNQSDVSERFLDLRLDEAQSHWSLGNHELASQIRSEVYELTPFPKSDQVLGFQELRVERDYAISLCDNGNPLKALKLLRSIVRKQALHVEENDHDLLVSRSELARCYSEAGYEAKALTERRKIRDIRENEDPSHHDTLIAMQDLANSFSRLRMTQDTYHTRYEIVKRFKNSNSGISEDHPSFLMARYNFAWSLLEMGNAKEALDVHRAVLDARLKHTGIGKQSSEVIASMQAISRVLCTIARDDTDSASKFLSEALNLRRRIVEIRQTSLSDARIDSVRQWLRARNDLAVLYQELRSFPASEIERLHLPKDIPSTELGLLNFAHQLHEKILQERTQLLGDQDRDTLQSMSELGQLEFAKAASIARDVRKKQYETALTWFTKIYQLTEEADPQKVMAEKNLIRTFRKLGRLPDTISTLERLLELQSECLGKDAVDTINTAHRLRIEYRSWKHNADANRKAEMITAEYNLETA